LGESGGIVFLFFGLFAIYRLIMKFGWETTITQKNAKKAHQSCWLIASGRSQHTLVFRCVRYSSYTRHNILSMDYFCPTKNEITFTLPHFVAKIVKFLSVANTETGNKTSRACYY
jgi:hypothetical protein